MSISRKPGGVNKVKQVFNPDAPYVWEENQEFVLLGSEFNTILKSLQAAADTPEFRRNAAIFQGLSAINNIFKDAVEQNLIKEQELTDNNSISKTAAIKETITAESEDPA